MRLTRSVAGSPMTTWTVACSGTKLLSLQSSPSDALAQRVMPYYAALRHAVRQNITNAIRNCGELFFLFCAKNPIKHLGRLSSAFMQKLEKNVVLQKHTADQYSVRQLCN